TDIKFNGKAAPDAIAATPGLWSTGEFGGDLRAIFNLHNHPIFEFSGENKIGNHAAWIFRYSIAKQEDPLWRLHAGAEMLAPPYGGELWIDEASGAVLRFNAVAKEIPKDFAMQSAELLTDYEDVAFGDGTSFVLPASASVSTKFRGEKSTRNV